MRLSTVLVLLAALAADQTTTAQSLHTATLCSGPGSEQVEDMIITSDGGCVSVGWTTSYGTGVSDETPNGHMIKFDATGAVQWTRVLGGSGSDRFNNVEETENGELFVSGYRYLNSITAQATLGRFSADGEPLWLKHIGVPGDNLKLLDMILIGSDSLALVCSHFTNGPFYDGQVLLLLADGQGNISTLAEVTATAGTEAERLLRTADGGYAVLCSRVIGTGPDLTKATALMKINANGELVWNRLYTDPAIYLKGQALARDDADGFWVFAVSGYGQTALLHVDNTGELIGQVGYIMGTRSIIKEVHATNGGGLLGLGYAELNDTTLVGMVLSLETDGSLLNARFLAVDDASMLLTAGQLRGDGTLALAGVRSSAQYSWDALLLQMEGPDQGLGSTCADRDLLMDTVPDLMLEISSPYSSTTPADVVVGDLFWTPSAGGESAIICSNLTTADRTPAADGPVAYPSPADDELYLHAIAPLPATPQVRIMDAAGRTAMTPSARATGDHGTWVINVQDLPPGLYSAVLEDEQGRQAVRFIKE